MDNRAVMRNGRLVPKPADVTPKHRSLLARFFRKLRYDKIRAMRYRRDHWLDYAGGG